MLPQLGPPPPRLDHLTSQLGRPWGQAEVGHLLSEIPQEDPRKVAPLAFKNSRQGGELPLEGPVEAVLAPRE